MGWLIYTRGTIPVLRIHHCLAAIQVHATRILGTPIENILFHNEGSHLSWGWDEQEMRALGDTILHTMAHPALLQEHTARMRKVLQNTIHAAEDILNRGFNSSSDEKIVLLFHELLTCEAYAQAWTNPEIDAVDIFPAEHVKEKIFAIIPEQDRMRIFSALTAPAYMSYITQEQIELLEILDKKRRGTLTDVQVSVQLQRVCDAYWWTSLGWEGVITKTVDDFARELDEYDKTITDPQAAIAQKHAALVSIRNERERLIKEYALPPETVQLINAFEIYTELHDLRKEMQVKTIYVLYELVYEVARRLDLDPLDLEWFTVDEICSLLAGTPFSGEEAARRRRATCMILKDKQLTIHSGDDAIALARAAFDQGVHDATHITGTGASKGVARGTARVCRGAKDALERVKHGDVLICGMTLPDYVPAMRKACAIVTDEGGITCHAAVISRELGKPCVIGTKTATRTFKDGDMVEVDGNTGHVQKL